MWFNLLIILITLLLRFVFSNMPGGSNSPSNRKKYIAIITVILILQSGLRNVAVGADTYQYYRTFEMIKGTSWAELIQNFFDYFKDREGKDPGYSMLVKIFQIFSGNYQLFLLSVATLFFTVFAQFIYRNTTQIIDAMIAFVLYSTLFYSFFSITGTRQTIATSLTLIGFELIKKRKLIYFILLILLAALIHKSALIFLLLYFLYQIKKIKFVYISILALFPLVFAFRMQLKDFFEEISGYDYGIYEGAGTVTFTFTLLLFALLCLMRYKYVIKINPQFEKFYLAISLAVFFTPLTWINPSAMRVVQYFSIFMILLLPQFINSFLFNGVKFWKVVLCAVIVVALIFPVRNALNTEYRNNEYKFFWQEMKLGTNYQ